MKGKFMSRKFFFRWKLLGVALMGVCPLARGTIQMRFVGEVTSVVDATHVLVDRVQSAPGVFTRSRPIQFDGIAAPEHGSPEEAALRDILEKTLLGKKIFFMETTDNGEPRSASIYVCDTDDLRLAKSPENNINLMLVREGFARVSKERRNSGDSTLDGLQEAQRLAQEERKGIWAVLEAKPEPSRPPIVTNNIPESGDEPSISPEPQQPHQKEAIPLQDTATVFGAWWYVAFGFFLLLSVCILVLWKRKPK